MKMPSFRVLGLCALLLLVGSGSAQAAIRMEDDLFRAVESVGRELAGGKSRGEIRDHLRLAIRDNPGSEYHALAEQLATDLDTSMKVQPASVPGVATPIMDTTVPIFLLYRVNQRSWPGLLKRYPQDPLAHLLRADRSAIEALIPALSDDSPTRGYVDVRLAGDLPRVWRVSDYALRIIELHSRCRFHFNAVGGGAFHEVSADGRAKIRQRIGEWWEKNRNGSIAEGIHDQLPQGDYYAKIEMAEELSGLEDGDREANREEAIKVLRLMLEVKGGYSKVRVAEALARMGDLSPMKIFRQRCQDALERPGYIIESQMVFYMTDYGERRDWEVLTRLAQREIEQAKDGGIAGVWPSLVNCTKAPTSPFAIPGLALALTRTERTGSRTTAGVENQAFSYADTAAEKLQVLTGKDFGYQVAGPEADRDAAIAKARGWWEEDGKGEYTFDRLEEMAGGAKD